MKMTVNTTRIDAVESGPSRAAGSRPFERSDRGARRAARPSASNDPTDTQRRAHKTRQSENTTIIGISAHPRSADGVIRRLRAEPFDASFPSAQRSRAGEDSGPHKPRAATLSSAWVTLARWFDTALSQAEFSCLQRRRGAVSFPSRTGPRDLASALTRQKLFDRSQS